MARLTRLLINLEPELIARIDAERGEVPRATFIRNRLGERYANPGLVRQPVREFARVYEYAPGEQVQLGPASTKPGARLKKERK